MKHYKLRYVMHDPSEETENKYLAEVPALPGCRAWGDTPEDALVATTEMSFLPPSHRD